MCEDIPAMHAVRKAVRENKLSVNTKIDEGAYIPYLERIGRGWVLEENGAIVAFAIGERQTGNIWALFVHEDHEGKGYGRMVQEPMVDWLFSQGLDRIHLTTGADTRAVGFYAATGWTYIGLDAHGDAAFERVRLNQSNHSFQQTSNVAADQLS